MTFNIRVYGLLINRKKEILVVAERVNGRAVVKFPGGGLEFGEGLIECIVREFKEELNLDIQVVEHFYTTDFFVPSVFSSTDQVIAVYYIVQAPLSIEDDYRIPSPASLIDGQQHFSWVPLIHLKQEDFALPIDKHVTGLLLAKKDLA